MSDLYRYEFQSSIEPVEIEAAILLSILETESLHGEVQSLLDINHFFDADERVCVIDASTIVGDHFNKLFVGLVKREFGIESFKVERLDASAVA